MLSRIWNLVWKEAIQFLRYKLLLAFVLVFPVWNLWSVAGSVSRGIMHIPTAVYDQDHSPASRRLVAMLRNSQHFDTDYYVSSQAELERLLERGTVKVGLLIPQDFEAELSVGGRGTTAQVLLDGTETTTSLLAQAYLDGAAYEYVQQILDQESSGEAVVIGELEQVEARSRVWFNEELRREVFQLPAEMAGALAMLAVLLPAVAIVREREMGTLEQLFVTPMYPIELIVGKSLVAFLIAYLSFLGMLALNVFHFQVPLRGSLALLMILTGYYIFVELGWGLLISVVARTQGQGFLGAAFFVILEVILSGQVLPVEYMPRAAQVVSLLMPNRHYTAIVRGIMLKGSTLGDLWPQVIALGILGIILYALAANRLRKRMD
ncbi:MAG: ABC transporter permease [Anaerolineae bacterium]|nr:ABC transporter permease [Anaerolineae bacterium]